MDPSDAMAAPFVPAPPQGKPSQCGRRKVRPQSAVTASDCGNAVASATVAGLNRSFGGRATPSLGEENNFDWFDGADAGTLQTPKNSDRHGSDADGLSRVMLPRSTRSIRHNVLFGTASEYHMGDFALVEAAGSSTRSRPKSAPRTVGRRDATAGFEANVSAWRGTPARVAAKTIGSQADIVESVSGERDGALAVAEGMPAKATTESVSFASPVKTEPPLTMSQRRGAPGISLGDTVDTAKACWDSGPCTAPKYGDRRDLDGSLEANLPFWRGSAAASGPADLL